MGKGRYARFACGEVGPLGTALQCWRYSDSRAEAGTQSLCRGGLWRRRRQRPGLDLRLEPHLLMRPVAKWFVFSHSAAAKRNCGPPGQPIGIPFGIVDDKIAFQPNGAVVEYGDFRRHVSRW